MKTTQWVKTNKSKHTMAGWNEKLCDKQVIFNLENVTHFQIQKHWSKNTQALSTTYSIIAYLNTYSDKGYVEQENNQAYIAIGDFDDNDKAKDYLTDILSGKLNY